MKKHLRIPGLTLSLAVCLLLVACQTEKATESAEETTPTQTAAPAEQPAAPPAQAAGRPAAAAAAKTPQQAVAPPGGQEVAAQPVPTEVEIAQGTSIPLTLNDTLSSKTNQVGDAFSAAISQPVQVGNRVAIPEGSVVRGTVARVERAGRVKGRAQLALRFEKLELADGQVLELAASLTALGEEEKETVTQEGQVKGEGSKKRDIGTIAGGAAIGTAIGAITGGKKGAGIGAATGAAAGTAVTLATRGKDVELKQGSQVTVQLDRPLLVKVK